MTAAERLAQIRARVEAATEGPWDAVEGATPGMVWVELRHRATICDFPYEQGSQEDAAFIAHSRADTPALLAAVEAVLALHAPREQAVLSDPDCLREECDHDFACPLTGSVTVCAACWAVAEGSNPYFCEEGVPDEVLHPCATVRAIEGPLS